MRGSVKHINPNRSMVAVLTEENYSIIELTGDELEIGDIVEWTAEHPSGSHTIRNLTRGSQISVFFQNHCVPQSQLRQQLLY